jgi:hypothetical protein
MIRATHEVIENSGIMLVMDPQPRTRMAQHDRGCTIWMRRGG